MLDWMEIVARLGSAAVIGGAVGINRRFHHKATGLRTLSLLATGAAGLVLATLYWGDSAVHIDSASRVIQGIMTGLGFIGAGVIMRDQTGDKVHGLTTAASVWTTAVLGALCGLGAWRIVAVLAGLVWIILLIGGPLEAWLDARLARKHHDDVQR
jgi:putative Mg2+ transporter-C (MgtC) family protein